MKKLLIISIMSLTVCLYGCQNANAPVSSNAVSDNSASENSIDPWENAEIVENEETKREKTLEEKYYDSLINYYPAIVEYDDYAIIDKDAPKSNVELSLSENSISENSVSENDVE